MVSGQSVSELSSRWEGSLSRRGDLPGPGGHLGRGGPADSGGDGGEEPVLATLASFQHKEHYDKIILETEEFRVKQQDTNTFINNINKYKCTEMISRKESGTELRAVVGEERYFSPIKRRKLCEFVPPPETLTNHPGSGRRGPSMVLSYHPPPLPYEKPSKLTPDSTPRTRWPSTKAAEFGMGG